MSPESFHEAWSLQVSSTDPRRSQTVGERVDAIVARVTRAARAAQDESTDAAIDAQLLAALVLAGFPSVHEHLDELDSKRR